MKIQYDPNVHKPPTTNPNPIGAVTSPVADIPIIVIIFTPVTVVAAPYAAVPTIEPDHILANDVKIMMNNLTLSGVLELETCLKVVF